MHSKTGTIHIILAILLGILLRNLTSLHAHSGQSKPPMYGDYEAQRHWMEITTNLPCHEWYKNTSRNDLLYWGLDYPPLTAYHMYACGTLARHINPEWVELQSSRGTESKEHKLFMRWTVLVVDLLVYFPALVLWLLRVGGEKWVLLGLCYPGLILVDHGHFQYNSVSLGLAVFAVIFLVRSKVIVSSVFFCLALGYKQMELYHALPFFFYILSSCIPSQKQSLFASVLKLASVGLTVLVSFGVVFYPFLQKSDLLLQVFRRLFPVDRGIFEDKVANVWCFLNIFFKFKKTFTNERMMHLSLLATISAVLPSSIDLFLRPNLQKFVPALINSSLAFFLFSYQVHEKSILLAAIPVILYFPKDPLICFWFLFLSNFSMLPLYVKDDLYLPYIALTTFFTVIFYITHEKNFTKNLTRQLGDLLKFKSDSLDPVEYFTEFCRHLMDRKALLIEVATYSAMAVSLCGCIVLSVIYVVLEAPSSYPDLFPLFVSVYSCLHFLVFFVYFNIAQLRIPQYDFSVTGSKVE